MLLSFVIVDEVLSKSMEKCHPFILKINMDYLSPIVNACVLNQLRSHWLFIDALQYGIIICLKFRE
jgi:hypothetical protein